MVKDKIKFEGIKLYYELENEIEELRVIDQKARVYGKNVKIEKVQKYLERIRTFLIGEGCEFYELGYCNVLGTKCTVMKKQECGIRKNELLKQGKKLDIEPIKIKRIYKRNRKPATLQTLEEVKSEN